MATIHAIEASPVVNVDGEKLIQSPAAVVHESMPSAGPAHLEVTALTRRFAGVDAVSQATFAVQKGEFFGLLGPSGCGKSTTLNMIAGFVEPTEGEMRLGEKLLNDVPAYQRGIAMVFQDYALFPHLTAAENVAFGLQVRRRPKEIIRGRVGELLDLVGLSGQAHQRPAQLSGGQQQRVAVARALAIDPEVVLLDEPFSNLDTRLRETMRRELKRILGDAGVTVILVTHDQAEAFSTCDRVAVMFAGRVTQVGRPADVYRRPSSPAVAQFIGDGDFFSATVVGVSGDVVRLRVEDQGRMWECGARSVSACALGETGTVLVRPEALSLSEPAATAFFTAQVTRADFLGSTAHYFLALGEHTLVATQFSHVSTYEPGAIVGVSWEPNNAVFFPPQSMT
jgi:ABC-type Fe3+/spermidine/putrescine transport system ATPase subunit